MRKTSLIILINLIFHFCNAQIDILQIEPIQTDNNYADDENEHLVIRNNSNNNNKLFLFLPGTGANPSIYQSLTSFAAELGYDAMSLSYKNNIPAAFFSNSENEFAFDNYRQEVCYGTDLSFLQVDSLNSIVTRTIKLLNYLSSNYPTQNWDQYLLDTSTLDWNKIVVAGHSQGAGHACYFGKFESVERVLMFAGPNDYSAHFESPANWLKQEGITDLNRYFSYLHKFDNVINFSDQFSNVEALGLYPLYDSTLVEKISAPFNNSRCLYLEDTSGLFSTHSKPIVSTDLNDIVWEYMMTSDIMTDVDQLEKNLFSVYPNPTSNTITIELNEGLYNSMYIVRNIQGETIMNGKIINPNLLEIDLSSYKTGIYIISIADQTYKLLKI